MKELRYKQIPMTNDRRGESFGVERGLKNERISSVEKYSIFNGFDKLEMADAAARKMISEPPGSRAHWPIFQTNSWQDWLGGSVFIVKNVSFEEV